LARTKGLGTWWLLRSDLQTNVGHLAMQFHWDLFYLFQIERLEKGRKDPNETELPNDLLLVYNGTLIAAQGQDLLSCPTHNPLRPIMYFFTIASYNNNLRSIIDICFFTNFSTFSQ
jgi:hypothetical protein